MIGLLWGERLDLRAERPNLRFKRPDIGLQRPGLGSGRSDLGSDWPEMRSERPDFGSKGLYFEAGGKDGKWKPDKFVWNHRSSSPPGPLPKK